MNTDAMREQCQLMTDIELIHALTVNKDGFSQQFHSLADHELTHRGISLSDFCNKVHVRHNKEPDQETTLQEALDQLPPILTLWETWFFTNCLGQILYFQREAMWTSVHIIQQEGPPRSFFIESEIGLKETVSKFLNLESMDDMLENEIQLDTWRIVYESESQELVRILSGMMADKEIPSTVKSQEFRSCACGGGHLKIMVPEEYEQDAKSLVKELDKERNRLYDEASDLPDDAPASEVMELYQRLSVLASNDALVFFNYGTALFELGQWENAAEAFTHSAHADLRSKENIRNNLAYLEAISEKMPESTQVLHTRAALATHLDFEPESIGALYRDALAIDPTDGIAHLNLGYLLYQHEGNDNEAAAHFKKYLEINLKAEDREHIEEILNQLQ
jgi:thioredoxin-like negative regulator of GroEL